MTNCAALGCDLKVQPGRLMCGTHWKMVPEMIQTEVWRTWEAMREYMAQPFDIRKEMTEVEKSKFMNDYREAHHAAVEAVDRTERVNAAQQEQAANVLTKHGQRAFPLLLDGDSGQVVGSVILDSFDHDKDLENSVIIMAPTTIKTPQGKLSIIGFSLVPTPPGWPK